MYRKLDFNQINDTIDKLHNRLIERFPESGLMAVCGELKSISAETKTKIAWINEPHLLLRFFSGFIIIICLLAIYYSFYTLDWRLDEFHAIELLQTVESIVNELIFISIAIFFLITLETRFKRRKVLSSINELRAIAHIIDMHQLTKDPIETVNKEMRTFSSPIRNMTIHQLSRYLDYCVEMLAIVGKVAAIYAQDLPETAIVSAVNELESLTNGLSRKIWQKLIILQEMTSSEKSM
ncbi:MAG: hypothetical protein KAH84_11010 [Thiomargarita sp.]|nr:hypothetical protein [Thiomargarita sp.]